MRATAMQAAGGDRQAAPLARGRMGFGGGLRSLGRRSALALGGMALGLLVGTGGALAGQETHFSVPAGVDAPCAIGLAGAPGLPSGSGEILGAVANAAASKISAAGLGLAANPGACGVAAPTNAKALLSADAVLGLPGGALQANHTTVAVAVDLWVDADDHLGVQAATSLMAAGLSASEAAEVQWLVQALLSIGGFDLVQEVLATADVHVLRAGGRGPNTLFEVQVNLLAAPAVSTCPAPAPTTHSSSGR